MSQTTVEKVIESRRRDLGGFSVGRVLPAVGCKSVGPFVFLDHMGPIDFAPGQGIDVRPHPHIGLSTVTYLFDGEIVHRDSLGEVQAVRPGDINWMTSGQGITHSERSGEQTRARGGLLHGLQLWVALPKSAEEVAPEFHHHTAATLPEVALGAVRLRVLAGTAYGQTSPVKTFSPLFFVEATLPAGAVLPLPGEPAERAIYIVEGALAIGGQTYAAHNLLVLAPGEVELQALDVCRIALLGGAALDAPRFIEWNFVSSRKERIEQAKRDWRERRFPAIPTDDVEFIPLPQ